MIPDSYESCSAHKVPVYCNKVDLASRGWGTEHKSTHVSLRMDWLVPSAFTTEEGIACNRLRLCTFPLSRDETEERLEPSHSVRSAQWLPLQDHVFVMMSQ